VIVSRAEQSFNIITYFKGLFSAIQAARLLSMHIYTPIEISRNDKNKRQTLLSQRKLALTVRNTFLHYKIIGASKKLKNGAVLYVGLKLTIHVNKIQIHLLRQSL
jgi:hypothetical protein